MYSIIENIVSELNLNLDGFEGCYTGKYDSSVIDNAKDNIFCLRDTNGDSARVTITGNKEPSSIEYDLTLVVQYADNINPDILFKKSILSINTICQNKARNIIVSYDSPKIAEDETGLKLKTELNLMKITFTYTHVLWLKDCNECLTDITC